MATSIAYLFTTILLVAAHMAMADPNPLQDICVADLKSVIKINGYPCKDPAKVVPEDFHFAGLANAGATNTTMGTAINGANVEKIPGLNTMGLSMSRIDYAPGGIITPHSHPRASEIIFVLEGRLVVGFVTSSGKHISKEINKGDVFIFPKALLHFSNNPDKVPSSCIAVFDSQLPGTQLTTHALFAADPPIPDDFLAKAFHLAPKDVQKVKSSFPPKKK